MKGAVFQRLRRRHSRARPTRSSMIGRLRAIAISVMVVLGSLWLNRVDGAAVAPANLSAGESLVLELGCVQCHADLSGQSIIQKQAPDLSHAGRRYQTAYLFDFLQHPRAVRRHIGRARMPDFHLTEKEALALALFLESQISNAAPPGQPAWPDAIRALMDSPPPAATRADLDRELGNGLLCLTCHALQGQGGSIAPDLTDAASRLKPAGMVAYLVAPELFGVLPTVMPSQFYQFSPDRTRFEPLTANPERRIATVVGYLTSLETAKLAEWERHLGRARAANAAVTAAHGEQLFRALNCAACHRHETIGPREQAAPTLTNEGRRVRRPWLESFLRAPVPVRRSGYHPGDGSRMPDFRLEESDVVALAGYLDSLRGPWAGPTNRTNATDTTNTTNEAAIAANLDGPLSAFSQRKAEQLLTDKLSCLGCHRMGRQGGVVGPDLSVVSARLRPEYVQAIIRNPGQVAPHSIMPKTPLPDATIDLIARYLAHRPVASATDTNYLSPLEVRLPLVGASPSDPAVGPASARSVRDGFLRRCAPCHGAEGGGDGFNAPFLLSAKPTAFTKADELGRRPDDTLFDGIHSGGAILNRSHWMPAWGESLRPAEISELVRHIRALCQCVGPAWSRDGTPTTGANAGRTTPR